MVSRKQLMSGVLMTVAVLLVQSQGVLSQTASQGVKNIVFVHGAFADGSSWSKVIPILKAKGYNVMAVQNPLTSVEDDVAATRRAIALMDGPVLLVGHSYGGMVVTAAGNDPKVAGLLYVCALIPNEGQSAVDVTGAFPAGPGAAEFRPDAAGFLSLSYKGIHNHFAQDLKAGERDILFATQGPWAVKATTDKVQKVAWKYKPSWCIIGLDDHLVIPDLARAEARMIKATAIELKSSHVPMLSLPDKVATFIMSAAQSL